MAILSADGTKILNNYDRFTGVPFNATIYQDLPDGVVVDNAIWFKNSAKLGGGFAKRDYEGSIRAEWFGIFPDKNIDMTDLIQKASDSLSDGDVIEFLPGKYIIEHIDIKPNTTWIGNYSTIKQIGNSIIFNCIGEWSKRGVTVTAIETVTQVFDGLNYFVSKIICDTTGIFKNDVVKIYSRDLIPNSSIGARYLGEFATVASVGDGFILLNSTLEDTYTTNIMLGILKGDTLTVDGFKFIGPDDVVVPADSGGGGGSPILFSSLRKPQVLNCSVEKTISNAIVMHSCYGYIVDNLQAIDLPNLPLLGRYGYGVCDANSDFGVVSSASGRNVRHLFTTNTYNITIDITNPADYGRSKDFKVVDGNCYGGTTAHYDTHDGALRGEFINCFGENSDWGTEMEAATSSASFQLRNNARIIGGGSNSDCGIKVFTPEGQNGGDNESTKVKGVEIINFRCEFKRNALETINANVKIFGGSFARVKGIDYGNTDAQKATTININRTSIIEIKGLDVLDRGINSSNMVTINNSTVNWDGGNVDLSEVVLNSSSQQVNFGYKLFYAFNVFVNNNIYFNNVNLKLNDRVIDTLARSLSVDNLINFSSNGVKAFVTSSAKTISTGGTFTRRIIGNSGSDIRFAIGFVDSKVSISNFKFYNIETGIEQTYDYNTQFTSIIQTYGRSDKMMLANINPPSDAFSITDIKPGVFLGQLLVIRNTHGTRTLILPNLTNTSISTSVTILPKNEFSLRWSGSVWEPATTLNVTLPTNYLTTDTNQDVNVEKVFGNGKLIVNAINAETKDIKIRSGGIDRWFIRATQIPSPGAQSGADFQFLARNDDGTSRGSVLFFRRQSLNSIFGEDTTDTASALVSMNSTTKGFLPPRMTTVQRDAIASPAVGLVIYNTDTKYIESFAGSSTWVNKRVKGANKFVNSDTTLTIADYPENGILIVNIDATANPVTITNVASSLLVGYLTVFIRKDGTANVVTIKPSGAELINNVSTDVSLTAALSNFAVFSDGSGLYKIGVTGQPETIINTGLTTTQTSASLNTLYPAVRLTQVIVAPNVGTGMEYQKVATTGGGVWKGFSTATI